MGASVTLPRTTADLRGLRAARWTRESRPGQLDLSGPAAQAYEQDEAMETLGLTDTGIAWEAGHSGWKQSAIATSEKWADMLDRAGRDYDVLVVAYVSRFCRNVNIGTSIREQLHAAGAVIYFADEHILTAEEDDWKRWIDLLVEAEHYSRNLKRTMVRTYKTKFRTHTDPGGMAPLGFRRTGGTPSVLEVDPATIGQAVAVFERYAVGHTSAEQLGGETGLHPEAIKPMLRNRIYNGWVQRYGEWKPAAWRDDPPVSDALWERCSEVRESRNRGGGPRRKDHPDLLDGLLYCACGQRLWSDGVDGSGQRRKRHRNPCPAWGRAERIRSGTWEAPISAQLAGLDLSPDIIEQVAAAFDAPPPLPNLIGRKQIERDRRDLATRYGNGSLREGQFLAEAEALRQREQALEQTPDSPVTITRDEALAFLRDLRGTWADAEPQERADLAHAVYEKIEVVADNFIGVTLTRDAEAHGLALALPEQVFVPTVAMVGGEGLEPPTSSV